MLIALTYNQKKGTSRQKDKYLEFDDPSTIEAIYTALQVHYDVIKIEADTNAFAKFKKYSPDIVFNIAEGEGAASRESQIPAMLDMLKIPYTGSNPLTLNLCLHKASFKKILHYHQLATPKFTILNSLKDIENVDFFPAIVKPLWEGSSKGIFNNSVVHNKQELDFHFHNIHKRYKQPAIVETFLAGREFTVAVLGNTSCLTMLPIIEISFEALPADANPIYSYEAKWIWDTQEDPLDIFTCPATLSPELEKQIRELVLSTYEVLGCLDWARIDVRLDKNDVPYILEVNPLPGILPHPDSNSCFPKAARTYGIGYDILINLVLEISLKRYRIHYETDYCSRYL